MIFYRRFDMDIVSRFILTVRKNYRRVPYHNWTHAFNVAHCMFCCIKNSEGHLSGLEVYNLLIYGMFCFHVQAQVVQSLIMGTR